MRVNHYIAYKGPTDWESIDRRFSFDQHQTNYVRLVSTQGYLLVSEPNTDFDQSQLLRAAELPELLNWLTGLMWCLVCSMTYHTVLSYSVKEFCEKCLSQLRTNKFFLKLNKGQRKQILFANLQRPIIDTPWPPNTQYFKFNKAALKVFW